VLATFYQRTGDAPRAHYHLQMYKKLTSPPS